MPVKHRPVADAPVEVLTKEVPPLKEKEPEIQGQKKVKVEADKIADEEVMIDYMTQSHSANEASKKTKENTEYKSSIPGDKPVGEIREEIAASEAKRSGDKFTFKDIHQIATFLINAFDGGISILLNFIARDNRVSVYSLPVDTKRQLADQLALILVKYQVKFKIEFLFFITLLLAYMGPVGGALKSRKRNAEPDGEKKKPGRPPGKTEPKEEPTKQEQTIINTSASAPLGNQEKKEPVNEAKVPNPVEEVFSNGEKPIVPTVPRTTNRPYERKLGHGRKGGQKKATL